MTTTHSQHSKQIPEIVEGVEYEYVDLNNQFMHEAYEYAKSLYEIKNWNRMTAPVTVLVKNGQIIAKGVAGDEWHQREGTCMRVELKLPSGVGYDQCQGCHPDNHSEKVALRKAREANIDVTGAEAYMYGHWWLCRSCLNALIDAGVSKKVFLLDEADQLFDRDNPNNVIGKPEQFVQ
jgi:deoxycytidylate deaminase